MTDLAKQIRAFIHKAMQMRDTNVDFEDIEKVKVLLYVHFGIHALRPLKPLFFEKSTGDLVEIDQRKFASKEEIFKKYHVFDPDLTFKLAGKTAVVEIDGDVHWQNSNSVRRTNLRNETYSQAGITMLWLTRENVRTLDVKDLVPLISQQLGIKIG